MSTVFDSRPCHLGEGALWHPRREMLFWFDILDNRLLGRGADGIYQAELPERHSAAAWIDADRLLLASETGLWCFDLDSRQRVRVAEIEAHDATTRSNDGRADPWGGFWIGTMGKQAQSGAGALYRFFRGRLVRLRAGLTIPNAICFAPDRSLAYFADTAIQRVWQWQLDPEGWPMNDPQVFMDFAAAGLYPDGAVTDADGALWIAHWGAGWVGHYDVAGTCLARRDLPSPQPTCPAFGAGRLYVTSAWEGMSSPAREDYPLAGQTFDLGPVAGARDEPSFCL
ncbi:SMP-30/Gluconolactonase/LRE-like region domain-containing protein [Bordetella tumbae]|uniref:SMP-30/gluconolactonase/LRE family protein n=1 Tax=Bordetella tumbae TaxID=1649139 RepID=UPI0039EE6C63